MLPGWPCASALLESVNCVTIVALSLRDNGSMNSLDGIRILDLSRVLAGPWCTQNLADLGADVLKIERPGTGDDTRTWGPPYLRGGDGQDSAEAAYYLGANRNKRSITCDIATPQGQDLIRELVKHCDVFIENFKVGDMARYGLDHATLSALNPRLVYCSITGFGQTGPYRERAGYDYAIQGMGGLMSVTGERDDLGGGPQKVGVAVADLFTGMYATVAILAALRHAERTGEGQHIDMALLDTQVAMLANLGANYLVAGKRDGKVPGRMGNAHQNVVPYQVFETAPTPEGQKDYMILAVGNDSQFAKFCELAGRPDLSTDARFTKNQDRVRNRKRSSARAPRPNGWPGWKKPRCPVAPSTAWPKCLPIRMCNRVAWSVNGNTPWACHSTLWPAPSSSVRPRCDKICRRLCWVSTPLRCCKKCWA